MARFPGGSGYVGPTHCYDDMMDPDQLLRRLAYGKAPPMLKPWQRADDRFYARFLDAVANAHVVLVKTYRHSTRAYKFAAGLRAELPAERFGIYTDFDPVHEDWNVLVYNRITPEMMRTPPPDVRGDVWIGSGQVARVLGVTPNHAAVLMDKSGVPMRRVGGRMARQIRQQDLVILANRKGAWRHRRPAPVTTTKRDIE
jgi:hypothetical protein